MVYGLPYAIGRVHDEVPEVQDYCGEFLDTIEMVIDALDGNECDDAPPLSNIWSEDCVELGSEIPKCMRSANDAVKVEECVQKAAGDIPESILHGCKCMGLLHA